MNLRVDSSVSEDYETLFLSDPGATAFHHPDFLRACEKIFRAKLQIWWFGDDCACPFVIREKGPYRSASSSGYGCYGGPIGNKDRFSDLLETARGAGFSRLEIVDFRNRLPAGGFKVTEHTAHILELPDSPDNLPAAYSTLRRRELKKQFQVSVGSDPFEFYRLHEETFGSQKTWITPLEGISTMLGSSVARFYTARKGEEIAGVLLVLSYGAEAIWWISGRKAKCEGVMTHLIHAAVSDAIVEGRRLFNFGATHAAGPARFKESFGARPYVYRSLVSEKGVFGLVRRLIRE